MFSNLSYTTPRKAITELVSKPLRNNIVSTFYFSSWIRTLGITLSSKRPEHIFTLLWRYGDLSGTRTHIVGVRGRTPKPLEDEAI